MSPALREQLQEDAEAVNQPIVKLIREILCAHYELDCTPIRGVIRKDKWAEARTMLIDMQPELFEALKQDSEESGETMRSLVLTALEAYYSEVVT